MKISYNWLKDYLDITESPEFIADKCTLLGLEVEETERIGSDFEGIVIGKVLDVKPHSNADKLVLCQVDTGNEKVQIVCGAKNVAAGQKVPVATVGSTLPTPMKDGSYLTISKAKLRGETSEGMICSESELGLSDDHSGIMVLDDKLETGTPFQNIKKPNLDYIFEIGLTPNRPDASCHLGVARDLSAVLKKEIRSPYQKMNSSFIQKDSLDEISISIEDTDKCHRYVGILVDQVKVKESPEWLKTKLKAIGLRPINNIVDVTNFVLHETGQPLHAFDYHLIRGEKIVVKSFNKITPFTTLDSIKRNLPAGSLFICDGEGPVAIAGVMGGENSEVTESTRRILIESAWFEPSSIRKTSKSLALQTDSSYRFERGIDPEMQFKAAQRAAELIAELAEGVIQKEYLDIHPVKTEPLSVNLRVSRVNHLLGSQLDEERITDILERLEFQVKSESEGNLSCIVPTFRPDISREVDLIEEVGRVFDYNNIPTPTSAPFHTPDPLTETELFQQKIRNIAKSIGYKEITTNSLLSKKEATLLADKEFHIDTLNPVSQENTTLRTSLTGGFLKAVRYNLNRNATNIRFFELGHIFKKSKDYTWVEGVHEHTHLLLGLCGFKHIDGWRGDAISYSVFDLKSDLEAFFGQLEVSKQIVRTSEGNHELFFNLSDQRVASLKRVEDSLLKGFDIEEEAFVVEIDLTLLEKLGTGIHKNEYTPIPKYPSFEFDAAFTVDQFVRAGEMEKVIESVAGNLLHSLSVFDVYESDNLGKDKKSIAFRLSFLDSNKTLNIKDVDPVVQKIVQALEKSFNAKLRS